MELVLVEPEFDFFVATEFFGGELEEVDFDFATAVKIIHDGVGDFGESIGADVAFNPVFIFVHDEEDVGLVKVLVELTVKFDHAIRISRITRRDELAKGKTGFGLGFGH